MGGSIFRFLLIKAGDLLYIKTKDESIIHIAYIKDNSNISFGKTYYDRASEGYEYNAFFLDNAEFSEPIKKNDLLEKCYVLLSEKYPNEKDILLDAIKQNIKHQNGTCLQVLKNDKDLRLKEVFYDALNFYTNQDIEYKTDLRCEKMMDIIINHTCKKKTDNANIVPIFYESLAEAMNNEKSEFDNHLTFLHESGRWAKASDKTIDGETRLSHLLGKIHNQCNNLGIPHLNYLIVNKTGQNKGKCGDGVSQFGLNENQERLKIWQYDWKSYKYIENEIKSFDDDKNNTDIFQNISETRVESRVPFPSKFVDMVLNKYPNLKDKCQSCEECFFEKEGGGFYFEIHHIKHYSKCRKEGINPHTIKTALHYARIVIKMSILVKRITGSFIKNR